MTTTTKTFVISRKSLWRLLYLTKRIFPLYFSFLGFYVGYLLSAVLEGQSAVFPAPTRRRNLVRQYGILAQHVGAGHVFCQRENGLPAHGHHIQRICADRLRRPDHSQHEVNHRP